MVDVANAQAVATAAAPAASNSALAGVISFAPFIIIMILFYFLMIYPQNKERKKKEEALNAIQRGDRILTRGGIYGTVADIKEQILIVKISENVKVEIEKGFVESVIKG
jgi:preprotein translocase subunit YajC